MGHAHARAMDKSIFLSILSLKIKLGETLGTTAATLEYPRVTLQGVFRVSYSDTKKFFQLQIRGSGLLTLT